MNAIANPIVQQPGRASGYKYSDKEFRQIQEMVAQFTGINLTDEKRQLTYSRYSKRLYKLGLQSFQDYIDLVKSGDKAEREHFISAITTNFTSFFREPHHFEHLATLAEETLRKKGKMRIWSAGCSSGEEPYSILMTLAKHLGEDSLSRVQLFATDLDRIMVERTQQGIYSLERIDGLTKADRKQFFLRGKGRNDGLVQFRKEFKSSMQCRPLNLLQPWSWDEPFDAIFCRNVVIYFTKQVQKGLFENFSRAQNVGDFLYIGHSENLSDVTDKYRLTGRTVYQRIQ